MDPSLLTRPAFWADPAPVFMGDFPTRTPVDPRLENHVMFATSGSTGAPRWIALSKHALLTSAAEVNRHLDVTPSSCWGLALPAHHVGGFGVAARAHAAGCGFSSFPGKWSAAAFVEWLADTGVTHVSLVPTQVHDLVGSGLSAPASLCAAVVGGGLLDTGTGREARSTGWPVLASYGMTETASQIATQGLDALAHPYQPSPLPILPHWLVRTDADDRIWLQGPSLFSGTLVCQTGGWIYQPRESGWFASSDRGLVEDKRLTPLGRTDLMVKVLGELVDIGAVELELGLAAGNLLPPGSFAVVPVRDARAGNALVPVFDSSVPSEAAGLAVSIYQKQCPGFRRLRQPVMVTTLPKSPLGKVLRGDLSEMITRLRRES